MRIPILTFVLFSVLAQGCTPKTAPPIQAPETPEHMAVPINLNETDAEAIVVAGLVQTPCFGSCPAFEALVYSNGKVTWRGDRNVTMMGNFEARVSEQWLAELAALAEQYGVYSMKRHYPADGHMLDDVPHTLVFLKKGPESIRIDNQADAPLELLQFQKHFLAKLMALDWKA